MIGSRPDGWWRDRSAAMRSLVAALERYAAETGDAVTVVFDGRERDVGTPAIEVRFARGGPGAADDAIAALAENDPEITVVTSDAELVRRVRRAGADVIAAGAFRRRLD